MIANLAYLDEDDVFDRLLPPEIQIKSSVHFTPVAVARRAAHLLAPMPGMRILDIGAGPGKFCVVAAREAPASIFVGVEVHAGFVAIARELAARVGTPNASFIEGNAMDVEWSNYDAFYFYNPFAEYLHQTIPRVDRMSPADPSLFVAYVTGARQRLAAARAGTRVVTYHTFGAPAPFGYELTETHPIGTDRLDLWIKREHSTAAP